MIRVQTIFPRPQFNNCSRATVPLKLRSLQLCSSIYRWSRKVPFEVDSDKKNYPNFWTLQNGSDMQYSFPKLSVMT